MSYSILGLDAQYSVSKEFYQDWYSEYVVRFNEKFLFAAPDKDIAQMFAYDHAKRMQSKTK